MVLPWYRKPYFWHVMVIVVFLIAAIVDAAWLRWGPLEKSVPVTETVFRATATDTTATSAKPPCPLKVGYYEVLDQFLTVSADGEYTGPTASLIGAVNEYTGCTLKPEWVNLTTEPTKECHLVADPLIGARAEGKSLILSREYDEVTFKVLVRAMPSSIENKSIYAPSRVIEAVQIMYPDARVTETPKPVGTAFPDAVVLRGNVPTEFTGWTTHSLLEISAVIGVPRSDTALLAEVNSVIARRPTTRQPR